MRRKSQNGWFGGRSGHGRAVAAAVLALVVGVAAGLGGCGPGGHGGGGGGGKGGAGGGGRGAEREPVEVTLAPLERRTVDRTIEVTGTLYGEEEATIAAKVGGRIAAIHKDLGDSVLPDEPLLQIERRDYELALRERRTTVEATLARLGLSELPPGDFEPGLVPSVARARAEAANAEARLQRARQLLEQDPPLISQQDFEDIQTAAEVAAGGAEVERMTAQAVLAEAQAQAAAAAVAEQHLADTTVRAPRMDGPEAPDQYEVAERLVSVGELVAPGQALFRLVATGVIKFRADVPERYAGSVSPGQRVLVRTESGGRPAEGVVSRVSPAIDPVSRNFAVEVRIPNADRRLKPGAFARGGIIAESESGVAFVPHQAVVTFAGVQKVFTVCDGKAVEHRIRTGAKESGLIEIINGPEEGPVVLEGAAALADGAPVRIATAALPADRPRTEAVAPAASTAPGPSR